MKDIFFIYLLFAFMQLGVEFGSADEVKIIVVDGSIGKDSISCGTQDFPCKTIQWGIDVCPNHGSVNIAPMRYTGLGNVNITITQKTMTLAGASTNFTAPQVIIDCEGDPENSGLSIIGDTENVQIKHIHFRGCVKTGAITAVGINSLAIANSEFSDSISTEYGGAVLSQSVPHLKITSCIFRNNTSAYGGAVGVSTGSVIITSTDFRANHAYNSGGAVYGDATDVTITDVDFDDNVANGKGDYLYTENAVLHLHNCTVHSACKQVSDEVCGGVCAYDGRCYVIGCAADPAFLTWKLFAAVVCGSIVFTVLLAVIVSRVSARRHNQYVVYSPVSTDVDAEANAGQANGDQPNAEPTVQPENPDSDSHIPITLPSQSEIDQLHAVTRASFNDIISHNPSPANMCKICFSRPYNTIFLPCKHAPACDACAAQLQECPICRARVNTKVGFYPS